MTKPPQRMSESSLAAAALFYLSRYASSSGNLKQVLTRKIRRSAAHYGDDPTPLMALVDALVAQHTGSGAVNDSLYAESQIRKLRRRGRSGRSIQGHLAQKGVPAEIVGDSAESLGDPKGDEEAALLFARRRRLGPFRLKERAESRLRDLAALGRAGFDYATARAVIDRTNDDAAVNEQSPLSRRDDD